MFLPLTHHTTPHATPSTHPAPDTRTQHRDMGHAPRCTHMTNTHHMHHQHTLSLYTHTTHHVPTRRAHPHIPILPHTLHRPAAHSHTPHISHIYVLPRPHTCHIRHSHYTTNGYSSHMSLFHWLSASKPDFFKNCLIFIDICGCTWSDTTERLHFRFLLSCIGAGNGNPLQYSCLENPRDGGAWWAAVYRVAQSRTRLKRRSSSSSSSSSTGS